MWECANYCDRLPVQHYYLSYGVKGLLKSYTLLFLDVDVYLQHEFAPKEP